MLVEEGVGFTILAPYQAAGPIEPGRTYRWEHPGGAGSIALVFYDGALSHDIAFGIGSQPAAALVARAEARRRRARRRGHRRRDVRSPPPLRRAGHRLRPGRRGAAARRGHRADQRLAGRQPAAGLGEGARERVVVRPWRGPLEGGLRLLVRRPARLEPGVAGAAARRPRSVARPRRRRLRRARRARAARPVGGARRLHRRRARPRHAPTPSSPATCAAGATGSSALTLLEAQRHAMLMYTSCGWFFDDIAGLEAIQVLRYAARCMDLLREAGDEPPEEAFLDVLDTAVSNDPDEGTGRQVWARHVVPARVTPGRVVAHIALLELLDGLAPQAVTGRLRRDRVGSLVLRPGLPRAGQRRRGSSSTGAPAPATATCTRRCTSVRSRWRGRAGRRVSARSDAAQSRRAARRLRRRHAADAAAAADHRRVRSRRVRRLGRPCPTRPTACCTRRRGRWPTASAPSSTGCSPTTAT